MAYKALYRQWRPQSFAEVVGQDHVVRTLQNALTSDRVAHAYLFAGPRGTGKTTMAKILAKAVNCERGPAAEPCNECPTCEAITSGRSLDVMEIDAASNRGIEEIRDLRDKVRFSPTDCRLKVYIIDEVHMLTNEAFNALLKTLEEPPDHVLFVMATTEPHKIPLTILSRCQRFDFHLLPVDLIQQRLSEVCEARGVEAPASVLRLMARHAEGALRDGLSILDQCLSVSGDQLTEDEVLDVLGTASSEWFVSLTRAAAGGDVGAFIRILDEVVTQGVDLGQFARDWLGHLRNLLLLQVGSGGRDDQQQWANLLMVREDQVAALEQQAQSVSSDFILQLMDALAKVETDVRYSTQPRLVMEVAVLRLMRQTGAQTQAAAPGGGGGTSGSSPGDDTPAGSRPKQPGEANSAAAPAQGESAAGPSEAKAADEPLGEPASEEPPQAEADQIQEQAEADQPQEAVPASEAPGDGEQPLDAARVRQAWHEVRQQIKSQNPLVEAMLQPAVPGGLEDGALVLVFPAEYGFHKDNVEQKHRQMIEDSLQETLGVRVPLRCVFEADFQAGGKTAGAGAVPGAQVQTPGSASNEQAASSDAAGSQGGGTGPTAMGLTPKARIIDPAQAPGLVRQLHNRLGGQVFELDERLPIQDVFHPEGDAK